VAGIAIRVNTDLSRFKKRLNDLALKQVPFATAKALTLTAKDAQAEAQRVMQQVFDRPTPFTLRSLFIRPATKARLSSMVYVKDDPFNGVASAARMLGHEYEGGTRTHKRLEGALLRAGLISSGEFVVPGAAARLDRYGNMSRGQVQQILSQLNAAHDPAAWASKSKRSRRNVRKAGAMFWSRGGALPRGAWQRNGRHVRPLLIVIRAPHYRQRMNLEQIVERVQASAFPRHFERALADAIGSAR